MSVSFYLYAGRIILKYILHPNGRSKKAIFTVNMKNNDTLETWKDCFDGFYQVSNKGRVKRKERIVPSAIHKGGFRIVKEKIVSNSDNGKGYLAVFVMIEGKRRKEYIHRLVAKAFLKNPMNKKYVNHIDFNKSNNSIENLEWCSVQENQRHYAENKVKDQFWGVRRSDTVSERYHARVSFCKKVYTTAQFDTKHQAAKARDELVQKLKNERTAANQ